MVDFTPPPEWAALDGNPPLFASPGWLTVMGHRLEGDHRYFIDTDATGTTIGFFGSVISDSTVTATKNPWDLLFDPLDGMRTVSEQAIAAQASLRAIGPPREAWFPALVMTYPGLESFALGSGARDPDALDRAIGRIVETARGEDVRTVAFMYVQPEEPELIGALLRAGFVEIPNADRANLKLPGDGFADYLRMLPSKARLDVGRIRRRLADTGVSIQWDRLSDMDDEMVETLVRLRASHRAKYGKRPDDPSERRALQAFRSYVGDRVIVYRACAEDQTIGFALTMNAGDVVHCWMTGADYADPRAKNTYFEMCYHAPIEAGYLQGVREISFGYGVSDIKMRRGCTLEVVNSYVLALDAPRAETARQLAAVLAEPIAAYAG